MSILNKLRLDIFLKEAVFFVLTYVLGILAILRIYHVPELKEVVTSQAVALNPLQFLLNFLIVTLIFLLLLPLFKRKPIFLKIIFSLSILVGLDVIMGVFFGEPYALAFSLILVVLLNTYPKTLLHNILFSCSLAGIGSILAISLAPNAIVIILAVLALYDVIAVYLTRHMIKMAKIPAENGIFFGLILPKKNKDFLCNKPQLKLGEKSDYFFLGGGDVVLPMILVGSVIKDNLMDGLIIALFSFLGLFLLHLMFSQQKKRKAMPGLPPLILMTLLGYLIVTMIK